MLGPSGFFRFNLSTENDLGEIRNYGLVYKPPGPLEPAALEQLIISICSGPVIPDAIVILTITEDPSSSVVEALKSTFSDAIRARIKGRIPLLHVGYSLRRRKTTLVVVDSSFKARRGEYLRALGETVDGCLHAGLENLWRPDQIILRAPPGYSYLKPSGSQSEYFLKPDLAMTSSAAIGFVALAVFNKLSEGRQDNFRDLSIVYVDTMAISPVAYALRDLLTLIGLKDGLVIESFHSYEGLLDLQRPLPRTSLCLISASSSMTLHGQILSESGFSSEEILTLVTLKSANRFKDRALYVLPKPLDTTAATAGHISIRVQGETFFPEQEPPKKVLLKDAEHRADADVLPFFDLRETQVFDVFRKPATSLGAVRALFVDGTRLIQQQEFLQWLERQLLHRVKATSQLIVYQDDAPSFALASLVETFCKVRLTLTDITLSSVEELRGSGFHLNAGVIVCAAVIGKGSRLLEISQILRGTHSGPRLFMIGFQVSETRQECSSLISNLRHSKEVQFEVARFGHAALGLSLLRGYELERRTFYESYRDLSNVPQRIGLRGRALGGPHEIGALALLPHGSDVEQPMVLRQGFAFWPPGYAQAACQPEVIATIACLLQRAREEKSLADECRLSAISFRQVILAPENFSRFNDGVVQSSLLRCAFPSELDYRSDHAASDFMKGVILRTLNRCQGEGGEALLEMLAALAMRRLQLVDDHAREVISAATVKGIRPPSLQRAIDFVVEPLTKKSLSKQKLPF